MFVNGGVQYFQQRADSVDRDIFSDERSKRDSRRQYAQFGLLCGVIFLTTFLGTIQLSSGVNVFNPQSWSLTPRFVANAGASILAGLLVRDALGLVTRHTGLCFGGCKLCLPGSRLLWGSQGKVIV